MPQAKRASKGQRPSTSKAVSVLGIAGVSLAASTGGSPADMPSASLAPPTAGSVADILWQNTAPFQVPTLDEEEISDVSLATFHLFDKKTSETPSQAYNLPLSDQAAAADTAAEAAAAEAAAAFEAADTAAEAARLRRLSRLQRLRLWRLRRLRLGRLGRLRRLRLGLGLRRLLLVVGRLLPLVLDWSALR